MEEEKSTLEEKLDFYRISPSEYERIKELMGREPRGVEWAIFSALWSEHCSYKSSKFHLKKLFNQSEKVLESFGENAGIVDLGKGERLAFKMESHNHPSFIAPYQGAATGVGGILRDIFTMGARPIALADYLCFGQTSADRMSQLVDGVVRGIGDYGNSVGVPLITGQTNFHKSYNRNILVNAMAIGLLTEGDPLCLSRAEGVGNKVVYVGAKTGRDGIHGASMASESFDSSSESRQTTVQIGDPFFEKRLIESCLEVMGKNLVIAIQDMGAAGLTSSSFEMAEKGNVGLSLFLDQVPLRDSSMTAEDILLSESQERMLLICKPEKFEELASVFKRWDLSACVIGEVIPEPVVRLNWETQILTELDPQKVVGMAPCYQMEYEPWFPKSNPKIKNKSKDQSLLKTSLLKKLLSRPEACSREWIYKQFDQRVGTSTALDCSSPVGVLVLPSGRPLGVVLGCRPHLMRQDPWLGGVDSVFYPALQLAAKGFEPLAVTDCLNFGNPEKKEVMTDFVASLDGMNRSCRALNTPIISGNVSFYNETLGEGICPTPATGLVGIKDEPDENTDEIKKTPFHKIKIPGSSFESEGDPILLVSLAESLSCGYFHELFQNDPVLKLEETDSSQFFFEEDLEPIGKKVKELAGIINRNPPRSSMAVGSFGLAYSLIRMGFKKNLGAVIDSDQNPFIQPLYQILLTVSPEKSSKLKVELESKGFGVKLIGQVKGNCLKWKELDLSVSEAREIYENSWLEWLEPLKDNPTSGSS